MMITILLTGVLWGVDFEALYDKATTRLVNFQSVKDSAVAEFVALGLHSSTADTTISFLVAQFDTKSSVERHTLKNILKEIGEPAIKEIAAHLDYRGSDAEARALKQSLWVLGEIGGGKIIEPAARCIRDAEWSIRSGAFTALGKSGSYKALPYILEGLDDSVAPVRKSAYHALSGIATEDERVHLMKGLADPFYGVRYASLSGLRRLGGGLAFLEANQEEILSDYFIMSLRVEGDTLPGVDELVMSASPAVRKVAYGTLAKEDLVLAMQREDHPLLIQYLLRRIAEMDAE